MGRRSMATTGIQRRSSKLAGSPGRSDCTDSDCIIWQTVRNAWIERAGRAERDWPSKEEAPTTAADFTGPLVPLQVKLPQDLVQS